MFAEIKYLHDKNVALGFDKLTEIVTDLKKEFKNNYPNNVMQATDAEFSYYGFNIGSKDRSIFAGMYFDLWKHKGYPFVLMLESHKQLRQVEIDNFKAMANNVFKRNYEYQLFDGFHTVCLKSGYFAELNSINPLFEQIEKLYLRTLKIA